VDLTVLVIAGLRSFKGRLAECSGPDLSGSVDSRSERAAFCCKSPTLIERRYIPLFRRRP